LNRETKNEIIKISEQIARKIETSDKFRKKIDAVMNGQIILFIKHGKINMERTINDEVNDEI
jgi:antitoxin component YwqK of YwqJK toxin-antitoxin module